MKLYTVLFHDDMGDAYNIGIFDKKELAERELEIFVDPDEYKEIDRETYSEDECRIYYANADQTATAMADISALTLNEFTY